MYIIKQPTSQAAWEYINEFLAFRASDMPKLGGVKYSGTVQLYDVFMEIHANWVDPEFDFGKVFGYAIHKWSKLKNNYINWDYLDIIRSEVVVQEKKKNKHYNFTIPFQNAHDSGKGCLLSLTFSRRATQDNPVLIITTRASEVTKRLLFDFLLVQRISEYIYGSGISTSLRFYCPSVYLSTDTFLMYNTHRPLKMLAKKWDSKDDDYTKKLLKDLQWFLDTPPEKVKFKIQARVSNQLWRNKPNPTIAPYPSLKAGDCILIGEQIPYPEDCITLQQRHAFKRNYNKLAK